MLQKNRLCQGDAKTPYIDTRFSRTKIKNLYMESSTAHHDRRTTDASRKRSCPREARKSRRQEPISKSGSGRKDTETEAIDQAIVDSAQQTTKSPRRSYNCPINLPSRSLKEAVALSKTTALVSKRITVVRLTAIKVAASCENPRTRGQPTHEQYASCRL